MHFVTVGLNHKTAPVDVRERLAFAGERLAWGLTSLLARPHVKEGVILSTCNRTEVYIAAESASAGLADLNNFMSECLGERSPDFERYLYTLNDIEVVQHLFRVVSSLDSMILGEAQILGQVKDTFHYALELNSVGAHLTRLFRHAVEVGKRVRTETEIGESAVSVSYAAVELARKIFGDLPGRSVLILGAGEMGELTVRTLAAHGVNTILVANRTLQRAKELAEQFHGEAVNFDALKETLTRVDIVISSTGAPHTVLELDMVREVMRARRNRPLFLIDIAVPRDIDPRVHQLDNVYLYNIDDLKMVVEKNLSKRELQIERAEMIIAEEITSFSRWWASRQVVPVIRALKSYGEEIQARELERLYHRLPDLNERERQLITGMARVVVNRLLHQPVVFLKSVASEDERQSAVYVNVLQNLFGLEVPEDSVPGASAAKGN